VTRPLERIDERWSLSVAGDGTRIVRRFRLALRGGLGRLVLAAVVAPQLRRAMRRTHTALGARLATTPAG